MAKGGNNKAGKSVENYKSLVSYTDGIISSNSYKDIKYNNDRIIIMKDNLGGEMAIGMNTGKFYDIVKSSELDLRVSNVGDEKKNGRAYVKFAIPGNDKFMIANYIAMIIVGELSEEFDVRLKSMDFKDGLLCGKNIEVNHANGNVKDNVYSNLDVTTRQLNLAHSRLMSELEYSLNGVYTTKLDNGSNMFLNGNKVTGEQIEKFNRRFSSIQIKAYKDSKGEFRPRFSKSDLNIIAKEFGLVS